MTRPALTLVLLPGMDGSGELFAAFIAALADAVVPLVVSYPPGEPLDYALLTAFVRCRLPPDQPFVLLGESFSGPVAIALAASSPPGLVALILCCSFARNPAPALTLFKHVLGALPMSASLTGLIAPLLLGSASTPLLREALRAAIGKVSAAVMRARLRAVLDCDYSTLMRAVVVPVLYLQAAQDRVVAAGAARYLATLQPQLHIVPIAGPHLLLQAAPVTAALAVRRFITSLATG
ncbi:alpha/beta fold hydrolase [Massilia sp. TSP1-1-2]|uniref:alpha/beta fold hydrolase n=1 Tax=Massilia sp. TSP1-1-2 TaxID=2804649 RepID=UPI003CF76149